MGADGVAVAEAVEVAVAVAEEVGVILVDVGVAPVSSSSSSSSLSLSSNNPNPSVAPFTKTEKMLQSWGWWQASSGSPSVAASESTLLSSGMLDTRCLRNCEAESMMMSCVR